MSKYLMAALLLVSSCNSFHTVPGPYEESLDIFRRHEEVEIKKCAKNIAVYPKGQNKFKYKVVAFVYAFDLYHMKEEACKVGGDAIIYNADESSGAYNQMRGEAIIVLGVDSRSASYTKKENVATGGTKPPEGLRVEIRMPQREDKVAKKGIRCVVLHTKTSTGNPLAIMADDILLEALSKVGFIAVSQGDIDNMVDLEKSKDSVGCDDISCMSDVGRALDAPVMIAAKLAYLENKYAYSITFYEVQTMKVIDRVTSYSGTDANALSASILETIKSVMLNPYFSPLIQK